MSPASEMMNKHQDIRDYIALGCIWLNNYTSEGRQLTRSSPWYNWYEVHDVSSLEHLLPSELDYICRLMANHWIRILRAELGDPIVLRIYLLPDDVANSSIDRTSSSLRMDLIRLCSRLDTSRAAWDGVPSTRAAERFDLWASGIDKSLFWMFNSLPSPSPDPDAMQDRYARAAITELLDYHGSIPAFKSKLYPFQARTAAAMLEKEVKASFTMDPRFEVRSGVSGRDYFYNARDFHFCLAAPRYDGCRGGILAETMGVGKTVICIALVLATRFSLPQIPPQYTTRSRNHERVRTLGHMATSCAWRSGVSLKAGLLWKDQASGLQYDGPHDVLQSDPPSYEIPHIIRRSVRNSTVIPPPRVLRLCSTTLIVVPRNLLHQWQAELGKHAKLGAKGLRVLIMATSADHLPQSETIAEFDVVLFSKTRFEYEIKDGQDAQGRSTTNVRAGCPCPYIGSTRIKDCSCLRRENIYQSPLKSLHFLRIIIDEGHEFSSSSSNAVKVATRLVTAERRWVVSGTPAKERLFGADVELAADHAAGNDEAPALRLGAALEARRRFNRSEEMNGASKSIGVLLANFLQVQPWVSTHERKRVEWEDFAFRHEVLRGRTHSAFSHCMASTLSSLVLKTRPEDIERDIQLPPLHVSVASLKPSFFDIITLNLFNFVITANAITSERSDVDYLFHPNSTAARHALIRNLRASAFTWTGWTAEDIEAAVGHSERYLAKQGTLASDEDREKLKRCVAFARTALKCAAWVALSKTHEMGTFVAKWPDSSTCAWSFTAEQEPFLTGATQLRSAQDLVNQHLADGKFEHLSGEALAKKLTEVGGSERDIAFANGEQKDRARGAVLETSEHGVVGSVTKGKKAVSRSNTSPKILASSKRRRSFATDTPADGPSNNKLKPARSDSTVVHELDNGSPLVETQLVATTSRKMAYLLDRVLALQEQEKILIFYDSDNAAWYISQLLDLFHVKHLIYARHLRTEQRSKYIVAFDTDSSIRVLLMDIQHGAWGLNVNAASRIFFINPPLSPHAEAQAIKRAHRIGQTRPVYVETLVLQGTVEEAMFIRSKAMTREEHEHAGKEISDDSGVAYIIQNAKSIELSADDHKWENQMAYLSSPLRIFGRKGRHDTKIRNIDVDDVGTEKNAFDTPKPKGRKKPKLNISFAATVEVRKVERDVLEGASIFG